MVLAVLLTNTYASTVATLIGLVMVVGVVTNWLTMAVPSFKINIVIPGGVSQSSSIIVRESTWLEISPAAWQVTWEQSSSRAQFSSRVGFVLVASCSSPAHVSKVVTANHNGLWLYKAWYASWFSSSMMSLGKYDTVTMQTFCITTFSGTYYNNNNIIAILCIYRSGFLHLLVWLIFYIVHHTQLVQCHSDQGSYLIQWDFDLPQFHL